jgi:proteasome lid subunit RPN8/RPN11
LLRLTKAVFDTIRDHGEQAYPYECCGALLGRPTPEGWSIAAAVKAVNARTDSPHNRYEISPLELVRIEREARNQGLEIGGFYHSHPDHPAHWSQFDLENAHWLGCSYVITAVVKGEATTTNSFLLAGDTEENKRFEPEPVDVGE